MNEPSRSTRLGDLAHARSGDKGDRSNIGVVARDAAAYAWLEPRLTEAAVAEFLRPLGIGTVRRYVLPRTPRVQLRDRACPGGGSKPLATTRHARQGAGHDPSRDAPGRRPERSLPRDLEVTSP